MKHLLCVILATSVAGCTDESGTTTAGAETVETTTDFPTVLADVVELRDQIRDGFAAGDVDAAHDPLHEIGHKLEELPELAVQHGLDESNLEIVRKSSDALFEAFSRIDATLHGREGSLYEDESKLIDENVALLQSMTEPKG